MRMRGWQVAARVTPHFFEWRGSTVGRASSHFRLEKHLPGDIECALPHGYSGVRGADVYSEVFPANPEQDTASLSSGDRKLIGHAQPVSP